ncbi:hypothetical protein DXG03_002144 [Asterophora parasitica]|uniref:Uncharacterized protein n=1 Tax=Asterophora parasitica TaxID=117018 RepID=A0A9P7KBC2_9AGAR|nr:hypothetical protein DXG03_002144 [Asterophora parasitica]
MPAPVDSNAGLDKADKPKSEPTAYQPFCKAHIKAWNTAHRGAQRKENMDKPYFPRRWPKCGKTTRELTPRHRDGEAEEKEAEERKKESSDPMKGDDLPVEEDGEVREVSH